MNIAYARRAPPDPDIRSLLEEIRKSLVAASLTLRCVEMGDADPRLAELVADACDETLLHIGLLAVRLPDAPGRPEADTRFLGPVGPTICRDPGAGR